METTEWTLTTAIQYALWQDGDTQKELAERLGWNPVRLSKILNGKQRLLAEDMREIAKAQNRDYSWYFEPPVMRSAHNPRSDELWDWFRRPIDVYAQTKKIAA